VLVNQSRNDVFHMESRFSVFSFQFSDVRTLVPS
jgi:hypothetical protein